MRKPMKTKGQRRVTAIVYCSDLSAADGGQLRLWTGICSLYPPQQTHTHTLSLCLLISLHCQGESGEDDDAFVDVVASFLLFGMCNVVLMAADGATHEDPSAGAAGDIPLGVF